MSKIEVRQGDITSISVDAIVNAANGHMTGGGGVDGAIHRAAGSKLMDTCRAFPTDDKGIRCPTGSARITPGFNLPARFVIHTVGPIYGEAQGREGELLASCYRTSLELAVCAGVRTISFPAISCGVYHYPIEEAADVSVRAIRSVLDGGVLIEKVILVAFDESMSVAWTNALRN